MPKIEGRFCDRGEVLKCGGALVQDEGGVPDNFELMAK